MNTQLIKQMFANQAIQFGDFVLKSGRKSNYFVNSALLLEGESIVCLAENLRRGSQEFRPFDVVFGPAYKGIPLAAILLHVLALQGVHVRMSTIRKESKTHGEGGDVMGADLSGKKVLLLDDVLTAGTAIRQSLAQLMSRQAEVVGVLVVLDRQEQGKEATTSIEITQEFGVPVRALCTKADLFAFARANGIFFPVT